MWIAVAGRAVAPKLLLRWHVAHWLDTDTLAWNCPGFQLLVPPLWQLSQLPIDTPLKDLYGMWLAVTPLAGGKPPLWHVAHWLATAIWLWFHVLGFHPATVWQLTQFTLVGMCCAVLPVAALPLWQLLQLVADVKPR